MRIHNYQNIGKVYIGGSLVNKLEHLQEKISNKLFHQVDKKIHPKEAERLERLKNNHEYDCLEYDSTHSKLRRITRTSSDFNDSVIIFSGGVGFGTKKFEYFDNILKELNTLLALNNTHLLFVRGNDDDPSYFSEHKISYSNIKTLEDYSLVKFRNFNCLCVGGGISFDRKWKQTQEKRINRTLYWENERTVFDKTVLDEILSNEDIFCVITHDSPSFIGEGVESYNDVVWAKCDKDLVKDAVSQRLAIDDIYHEFKTFSKKPLVWAFSGKCEDFYNNDGIQFISKSAEGLCDLSHQTNLLPNSGCNNAIETLESNLVGMLCDDNEMIPFDFGEDNFVDDEYLEGLRKRLDELTALRF